MEMLKMGDAQITDRDLPAATHAKIYWVWAAARTVSSSNRIHIAAASRSPQRRGHLMIPQPGPVGPGPCQLLGR